MQAIMSLIQFGEYVSWKLPKKTHLLLTSNEDDGAQNITSLDSAQRTRLLNFHLDFSHEQYGKWMDKHNLNSQAINFMLLHPEIFSVDPQKHTQNGLINARTYTMFAQAIAGLPNFDSLESLTMIDLIAQGCFGKETNIGNLFVAFVHNNLDKLMSAKDILSGTWDTVKEKLKENIIKEGEYRVDIASVLTIRLINYITNNKLTGDNLNKLVDRIKDLLTTSEQLLTEDLLLQLVMQLNSKYPTKTTKLLTIPKVIAKLTI